MTKARIQIPKELIAEFCRKNQIQRLSLFGSALRDDFGPDSDVDVLVEFKAGTRIGLIRFAGLELVSGPRQGGKAMLARELVDEAGPLQSVAGQASLFEGGAE